MTRTVGHKRGGALQSADHYKRHRKHLMEKGTVKKEHADSTKENMYGVMMKWTRYCEFIGEDRLDLLVHTTKEDIMTFFKWVLDSYPRIRKRSSLHEYWRLWRMLYRKSIGQSLHAKISEEINDYIDGYLTRKYALDTTTREKPVMNVDDIFLILHHHWAIDSSVFPDERQRLQLAFLLLLSAYTATRPGALVYSTTDRKKQREHYIGWENDESENDDSIDYASEGVKTLCYEDVTLLLLPNPNANRDVLVMEVTLRYTKGWKRKPNPKTYILTEVSDLLFDPVVLMIAIAILDNAFEPNIRSVEDIFRTRVRAPRNSLELKWKAEKLKIPIFRTAEAFPGGVATSDTKALRYHTYLYYLQRLGLAAGFMQILGAYVIRRGAGEAVDAVATQAQLQQVMGHRDAGIYQAYINRRVQCDVQAAFLGKPSSTALFKSATHMSRYVDPRAPTEPSSADLDVVKIDPEIVRLRQLRDHLSKEVRQESGTLKNAEVEGTKLHRMYKNTEDALRCTKAKLRKSAQEEARQRFFDTIDTQEINKQLDPSFLDLEDCAWKPKQIEHALEERTLAAELLCKNTADQPALAQLEHRMKTITTLIALCKRREAPQRCKKDDSWGVIDGTRAPDSFPTACEKTQCLFCFGNQQQPQEVRLYRYASIYKARNHVESHLRAYKPDQPVPCPHLTCQRLGVLLIDREHFINHAAAEHGYDIFRKSR